MKKPALELVARALCRLDGHPENIMFEGKPMWQSFLPNDICGDDRRGIDRRGLMHILQAACAAVVAEAWPQQA